MKATIFYFTLFFFGIVYSQTEENPLNVLFVGNSITYFNNLPQTFEQIANEQGNYVTIDQHTPGGTGFIHHVENNTLYEKFRNTVWDYVILQPGSSESIGYSQPIASTIQRAERLKDSITKYSPCASIHYYEISYGIVDNTPESLQQYYDRQTIIKNNLTQMANATNIPLIPAGECFKASMQANQNLFLWGSYMNIHPNTKGSYLAACSFYNAIFKAPIVNTTILNGIDINEATSLRDQAEATTLNHLDDWLIDSFTSTANFNYSATNATTLHFTNTSSNNDHVSWDFGDGTTSTLENPTHSFDFNIQNNYTIVLTAYKDCKKHHKVITITQDTLTISETHKDTLKVYPNPFKNLIYLDFINPEQLKNISIYDSLGKEISSNKFTLQENTAVINMSKFSKGIYFIKIKLNNKMIIKQVIKN